MKFLLNNREEESVLDSLSVSDLLELKKYSFRMRIIKINGILISKDEYDSTLILDGDDVQIIYLMSGG
jgi:sulfur carrier protein